MNATPKFNDVIRFDKLYTFKKDVEADYPEYVINSLKNSTNAKGEKAYPMLIRKRVKEVNKAKIK